MKKSINDILICIWGNDNYNTLGLLRQLDQEGFKVFFIINKRRQYCASLSRHCKSFVVARDEKRGLSEIYRIGKIEAPFKFLITTSDTLAEIVDANSIKLKNFFILSNTESEGLLTSLMDKNTMCSLAERCGLTIPRYRPFFKKDKIEGIDYPCIIKPSKRLLGVKAPFKARICNNDKELKEVQDIISNNESFILQQYIPKKEDILVYGCRTRAGEVILAGSFIKKRWAYDCNDGSYGTISCKIPECINLKALNSFLEQIEYVGLFSFEFGYYKGQAFFYEINMRNDGTSHYFYQAGVNLPILWIRKMIDESYSKRIDFPDAIFMDEIADYNNVKKGVIPKTEWLKDKREATVFKYYAVDDRLPYNAVKLVSFLSYVKRNILRIK